MTTQNELIEQALQIMKTIKLNFNSTEEYLRRAKVEITASTNPLKRNATALAMSFSSLGPAGASLAPSKIMSKRQISTAKKELENTIKNAAELKKNLETLEELHAAAEKIQK